MSAFYFQDKDRKLLEWGMSFTITLKLLKKIFKKADENLNYPLSKIILEGPEQIYN